MEEYGRIKLRREDIRALKILEKRLGAEISHSLFLDGGDIYTAFYSEEGRVIHLMLAEPELTEFPDEVLDLNGLKVLFLDAPLKKIPRTLFEHPTLTILNFLCPHEDAFDFGFPANDKLKTLAINDSKITVLPPHLENLSALQDLNLSRNRLKSLPKSLGDLKRLESIHLLGNRLTSLPKTIGQLKLLKILWASGNRLKVVPASIGDISILESLHLSGNRLRSLPKSISNLQNLQDLKISSNQFTSVPQFITKLKSLKSLGLSNNQLQHVPEFIQEMHSLESLTLGENPLSDLPDFLCDLPSLKRLHARHLDIPRDHPVLERLREKGVRIY